MTAGEFWEKQAFSYIITYSFNRGPKLAALTQAAKHLLQQTRQSLLTAPAAQLPALRAQLRLLEKTHNLELLSLTDEAGAFHLTASPVAIVSRGTLVAQELAGLLRRPVLNQLHWMCWPVYRDALAFYDAQDHLLSVLNICFDCDVMQTDTGQRVEADAATYPELRTYLQQAGHQIA